MIFCLPEMMQILSKNVKMVEEKKYLFEKKLAFETPLFFAVFLSLEFISDFCSGKFIEMSWKTYYTPVFAQRQYSYGYGGWQNRLVVFRSFTPKKSQFYYKPKSQKNFSAGGYL